MKEEALVKKRLYHSFLVHKITAQKKKGVLFLVACSEMACFHTSVLLKSLEKFSFVQLHCSSSTATNIDPRQECAGQTHSQMSSVNSAQTDNIWSHSGPDDRQTGM